MFKKIIYFSLIFILGFSFFFFFSLVTSASAQTTAPPSCAQDGFIPCIQAKFSSKFPFDIFSGVAALSFGASACPSITLMYKDFDICFLLDFLKVIKYPVAISLLIKLFIFS